MYKELLQMEANHLKNLINVLRENVLKMKPQFLKGSTLFSLPSLPEFSSSQPSRHDKQLFLALSQRQVCKPETYSDFGKLKLLFFLKFVIGNLLMFFV